MTSEKKNISSQILEILCVKELTSERLRPTHASPTESGGKKVKKAGEGISSQ